MNTIKKQLREFYTKNNIGMKRMEKLIKSDINSIVRHTKGTINASVYKSIMLDSAFIWKNSPEGFYYWQSRDYQRIVENIFDSNKGCNTLGK